MKRVLLIVAWLLGTAAAAAAGYIFLFTPAQRAAGDLKIEPTPGRIARGEYLVNHVVVCFECHTKVDESKRILPHAGPEGAGGACFTEEIGFPGHVCPGNITPDAETGIGAWSDDEILRAVREGVAQDGRALFPIMPYPVYNRLPDEDAQAIVAYIRSIEPVRQTTPETRINFPVNLIIRTVPKPLAGPVGAVATADLAAYGEHMIHVAGCTTCHGEDLSGGDEFPTSQGTVRSSNLTPGADGIVPEDFDDFLRIFRAYEGGRLPEGITDRDFTVMPWVAYSGMEEEQLHAIHTYLRSLPPVVKQIQTYGEVAAD